MYILGNYIPGMHIDGGDTDVGATEPAGDTRSRTVLRLQAEDGVRAPPRLDLAPQRRPELQHDRPAGTRWARGEGRTRRARPHLLRDHGCRSRRGAHLAVVTRA